MVTETKLRLYVKIMETHVWVSGWLTFHVFCTLRFALNPQFVGLSCFCLMTNVWRKLHSEFIYYNITFILNGMDFFSF